jgi:2-oxoglutarate/2-oxoacid ferredoxin oxidoreductase subunit beta
MAPTPIPTDAPPRQGADKVADFGAPLQLTEDHHLCAGCGHPVAWRILLEVIDELDLAHKVITAVGHGCYTGIASMADLDCIQVLHGRAPAVATGIKRVQPQAVVATIQGDGDMATEGLHEVLHAAARGERITAIMLNNGVFGDTGGQMTATTVVGQRTKTSLEGRAPADHGFPIALADLMATMPGAAYVARGAVNNAGSVAQTKKFLARAFETQLDGLGFSFVEILTMCPTGWIIPTAMGPDYVAGTFEQTFPVAQLKAPAGR